MNFRDSKSKSGARRAAQAVLDITPLIDVVFLLLIFFLLTATFVTNPSMPVDLPKASQKITERVREDLVVTVHKTGELEFQKKVMDLREFRKRLRGLEERRKKSKILIRADSKAVVGRMVEVMDVARDEGFTKFSLAIRPR